MPNVTLAALQSRIYSRLDSNVALYNPSEVTARINESIRVLNVLTQFNQASVALDITTQVNRIWYDVPYSLIIPTRVQIDGKYLKRGRLLQTGRARPMWVTETGATILQPTSLWIPFGLRKFAIWPADAYGGQQIVVTGVAETPLLALPTDSVNLSNDLVSAVDLLAVHVLQLKESPRAFAQASTDYQAFLRMAKRMTALQSWKAPSYFIAELQQPNDRK